MPSSTNCFPGISSSTPIISPGAMPAMKSFEIDTLAATPKMTSPIEGGRIGAMIPDEAITRPTSLEDVFVQLTGEELE